MARRSDWRQGRRRQRQIVDVDFGSHHAGIVAAAIFVPLNCVHLRMLISESPLRRLCDTN
jgi:hypothetical protein